jgi:flavin-binding protein dodecin
MYGPENPITGENMKGSQTKTESIPSEARFLSTSTVFKSIELTAESEKSWEDAAQQCVREAAETIKNIRELKVESMKPLVDAGRLVRYRVRCRVAFAVDTTLREH